MGKSITEAQVVTWGEKVGQEHLAGQGSINDLAAKHAVDEGLNFDQGRRVTEAANHFVYNQKMGSREPGEDIRFELGDPDAVVSTMKEAGVKQASVGPSIYDPALYEFVPDQPAPDVSKLSSVPEAYRPPPREKVAVDISKLSAVPPEEGEIDTTPLMDQPLSVRELKEFNESMKIAEQNHRFDRIELERLERSERAKIGEIVRQFAAAGHDPLDLYKAAVLARPDQKEAIADLFGEIFSSLAKKGYVPVGGVCKIGAALPASMVSSKLKELSPEIDVEIINGAHPIFISIDTLGSIQEDKKKAERGEFTARERFARSKKVLTDIARQARKPAKKEQDGYVQAK